MNMKKNNKGFSLVELIVVIAIMAILAAVAVVGVSIYIPKAQQASDDQLIADINYIFKTACMEQGIEMSAIRTAEWDSENWELTKVNGDTDHSVVAAFNALYDIKNAELKYYKSVAYSQEKGFYGVKSDGQDSQYSELFNTLKDKYGEDIANKILTSNLGAIGTETLFDQLNGAVDMAGALNLQQLGGNAFFNAYMSYLGINLDDYDSNEEAQAALDAKLAALGVDDATAANNAIALYAAQNSSDLTIDSLEGWLNGNSTTDDLQGSASANTLAEAAAIYGLYLSYQQQTNGAVPEGNPLQNMNNALRDSGFIAWVKDDTSNAQAELDAYKTYMDIVNEASKDDNTRNEILVNGFQDPELEDLMKELVGE